MSATSRNTARVYGLMASAMRMAIVAHEMEGIVHNPVIVVTDGEVSPSPSIASDAVSVDVILYPLNPHTGTKKVFMSMVLTHEVLGRTDKQLLPTIAQYAQSLVHAYIERNGIVDTNNSC